MFVLAFASKFFFGVPVSAYILPACVFNWSSWCIRWSSWESWSAPIRSLFWILLCSLLTMKILSSAGATMNPCVLPDITSLACDRVRLCILVHVAYICCSQVLYLPICCGYVFNPILSSKSSLFDLQGCFPKHINHLVWVSLATMYTNVPIWAGSSKIACSACTDFNSLQIIPISLSSSLTFPCTADSGIYALSNWVFLTGRNLC